MQRVRSSGKFLGLLIAGLAVLGGAFATYDIAGRMLLKGAKANNGFIPLSGYETYFSISLILAPIGCILLLAGAIGVIEKLLPRSDEG